MNIKKFLSCIFFTLLFIFSFQQAAFVYADTTVSYAAAANGTCGLNDDKVYWEFENGVLTISGSGAMNDFITIFNLYTGEMISDTKQPWENFSNEIKEVIVKKGVTVIGYNAFYNCNNLKKVTLANSVKKLRPHCFSNDFALNKIDLGKGLISIESYAFWNCPLKSLSFPKTLKKLDSSALLGLSSLQNFYVETSNPYYKTKDGVLFSKDEKTLYNFPLGRTGKFTVPKGTITVKKDSFSKANISELKFSNTVTNIEAFALSHCEKLTKITFPSKLKNISDHVCIGCNNLSTVLLPKNLKTIDSWAFHDCPSLKKITLPYSVTESADAFSPETTVICKNKSLKKMSDGSYQCVVEISVYAHEEYKKAFEVLEIVNKERKKAGQKALVMDKSLLDSAMLRAYETALYWDHTRPNGLRCATVNSIMFGENIAYGSPTSSDVMKIWMTSDGHKSNILGNGYKSIGIGCVKLNGCYYWVQCFGNEIKTVANKASYSDKNRTRTIQVKKDSTFYKASFNIKKCNLKVGETTSVNVNWKGRPLKKSNVKITSSNSNVCQVQKNGKLKALKSGKAVIKIYFTGYKEKALKRTINVSKK